MPITPSQTISPFLWFNANAEEAVNFYVSIFKDSGVGAVSRYGAAGPGPEGSVMTIDFQIAGQRFTAMNGNPHPVGFSEAVSFVVNCESQAEIDEYWDKLTAQGGKPVQCGWLRDRFGMSWQIVPTMLWELITDPVKSPRVMQAVMRMVKLDIEALRAAAETG